MHRLRRNACGVLQVSGGVTPPQPRPLHRTAQRPFKHRVSKRQRTSNLEGVTWAAGISGTHIQMWRRCQSSMQVHGNAMKIMLFRCTHVSEWSAGLDAGGS